MPAKIEAIRLPIGFRSIHTADLVGWKGDQAHPGFAQLMTDITAALREAPAKERGAEQRVTPPSWASASGQDRYGSWVEIRVPPITGTPVIQRLRWIPLGRFRMGSPETEAGRYDNEGPQHAVQISRGFWLFDTPCTQALWEAVMGNNPSRFPGSDRPVEQISWNDVQGFLKRIEERVPGLGLELPTEAQWEYACRAGTDTATYAGDPKIIGENNVPGLDAIAWYGDNAQDETHPVGQKEPNAVSGEHRNRNCSSALLLDDGRGIAQGAHLSAGNGLR